MANELETLAVIAVLSKPTINFLKMEFQTNGIGSECVTQDDFINNLKKWWRDKTLSDDEWNEWASNISVAWVLPDKRTKT